MVNVSKKNSANDAALSAIEEALSLATTEVNGEEVKMSPVTASEPSRKNIKIEKPVAREPVALEIDENRSNDLENSTYTPPISAANDERSDLGQLLYTLSKKPSNMPLWIAFVVAVCWVTIASLIVMSNNMFSTGIGVLTSITLITAPVLMVFGFAYMMVRASEMRLVARGMTEVALRLAEPENVARDAVASVGQAVRREVEAMNAGVTQTLRHATELESRVTNEVKMIEQAFINNEGRIRELVNELSMHRVSMTSHTQEAQGVFSLAHQGLISELTSRSQDLKTLLETTQNDLISRLTTHNSELTDNLTNTTAKVIGEFQNKSQQLGDNLTAAGNSVMDTIHMRTTDILDRLSNTGDDVSEKITTSSNGIISTISREITDIRVTLDSASNAMTSSLQAVGSEVSSSLTKTGGEVTDAISLRANEVNNTLKLTGDSLVLDLGLRGSEVTQKLDETGSRIAEYITDRGNELADRISETGNKLYETVNVYGVDLDKRLAATGENIALALQQRTDEAQKSISEVGLHVVDTLNDKALGVQSALHQAGESVSQAMIERAGSFKGELEQVGIDLMTQFALKNSELTDKFSLISTDFSLRFQEDSGKVQAVADKLGLSVSEMSGLLQNHVNGFDELASRLSMDVALKMTESASGMSDKMRQELMNFDKSVSDKTQEVSATLDERLTRLDQSLAIGASDISRSLAERAVEIANTLSNGGASVTAIIEEKSNEMTRSLMKQVETINDTLGVKANEVANALGGSVDRIGKVSEHISNKTGELASLFDEKGSSFLAHLGDKSDHISAEITKVSQGAITTLEQRGTAITDAIFLQTTEFSHLFNEKGSNFLTNLGEKSDHISAEITKISQGAISTLETRGTAITDAITLKTTDMQEAMRSSALSLATQISSSTEQAVSTLQDTQQKIATKVEPLIMNLTATNATLKELTVSAETNLLQMGSTLSRHVFDLQKVVDNVTLAAETGVAGLDKQVIALQNVSGGTLTTLGELTSRVEKQTGDLANLNKFFDEVQSNFNGIIEDRRSKLEQLVNHIGDRSTNMEEMLTRFKGNIDLSMTEINTSMADRLIEAQKKTTSLVELLGSAGKEQSHSLAQHVGTLTAQSNEMMGFIANLEKEQAERLALQVTGLKENYSREREMSQVQIQKAYDTTLSNIDALYLDSSAKFNELTVNLKSVSSDIGRELEATRAELKRGLIDLPSETQEHASNMRRVVADQMKALAELNDIVVKSGRSFDTVQTERYQAAMPSPRYVMPLKQAEPVVTQRLPEPEPEIRYEEPPVQKAPAKARKKDGWLSDIIARASSDDEPARAEPNFGEDRTTHTDMIDRLPAKINSYVDHDAVSDLWEKYRRGEKNVFNRLIYTSEGHKAFDDVRSRYSRSDEFRNLVDRYIEEFERMLSEVNRTARDPSVTRNALISDTGKTYTLLAHASGRFEVA